MSEENSSTPLPKYGKRDDLTEEEKRLEKIKANDRYATQCWMLEEYYWTRHEEQKASDRLALQRIHLKEIDESLEEADWDFEYEVYDPNEPDKNRCLMKYFEDARCNRENRYRGYRVPEEEDFTEEPYISGVYSEDEIKRYGLKLFKVKGLQAGFALNPNPKFDDIYHEVFPPNALWKRDMEEKYQPWKPEEDGYYEIALVFNRSKKRNVVGQLLQKAIEEGGRTLSYFDVSGYHRYSAMFPKVYRFAWDNSHGSVPEKWPFNPIDLSDSSYKEIYAQYGDNPPDEYKDIWKRYKGGKPDVVFGAC